MIKEKMTYGVNGKSYDPFSKQRREQLAMGGSSTLNGSTFRRSKAKARITVVVRKRPLSQSEASRHEADILSLIDERTSIKVDEPRKNVCGLPYTEAHQFVFDRAYSEKHTNKDIYTSCVRQLVDAVFENGSKCACFAYGQTGSGKTYTMVGSGKLPGSVQGLSDTRQSQNISEVPSDPGLLELAARDCFQWLDKPEFCYQYGIYVSFFEIYCNKVYDLLNGRRLVKALETKTSGGVVVKDLKTIKASTIDNLLTTIGVGLDQRIVGINSKNTDSSRGHAILTLEIKNEASGGINYGKLAFIDLAGSERGADAMGSGKQTQTDGAGINRSLLALKECIRAMDQQSSHVPFRDSELTKVLRDMFIGSKTKTLMISCVSPSSACCEQTLNTLRYADRVKTIRRNGSADVDCSESETQLLTARGDEDIEVIRHQLEEIENSAPLSFRSRPSCKRDQLASRKENERHSRCLSAGHLTKKSLPIRHSYSKNLNSGIEKLSDDFYSDEHRDSSQDSDYNSKSPGRKESILSLGTSHDSQQRSEKDHTHRSSGFIEHKHHHEHEFNKNSKKKSQRKTVADSSICLKQITGRQIMTRSKLAGKLDRSIRANRTSNVLWDSSHTMKAIDTHDLQSYCSPRVPIIEDVVFGTAARLQKSRMTMQGDHPLITSRQMSSIRKDHPQSSSIQDGTALSSSCYAPKIQFETDSSPLVHDTYLRRKNDSLQRKIPSNNGHHNQKAMISGSGSSNASGKRTTTAGTSMSGTRFSRQSTNKSPNFSTLPTYTFPTRPQLSGIALKDGHRYNTTDTPFPTELRSCEKSSQIPLVLRTIDIGKSDISKIMPKHEKDDTLAAATLLRKRYKDLNFPLLPETRETGKALELETAVKMLKGMSGLPAGEILKFYDSFNIKMQRIYTELVKYHLECVNGQKYLGDRQSQILDEITTSQQPNKYELDSEYVSALRRIVEFQLAICSKLGKRLVEMEKMMSLKQAILSGYQAASATSDIEFYPNKHESREDMISLPVPLNKTLITTDMLCDASSPLTHNTISSSSKSSVVSLLNASPSTTIPTATMLSSVTTEEKNYSSSDTNCPLVPPVALPLASSSII